MFSSVGRRHRSGGSRPHRLDGRRTPLIPLLALLLLLLGGATSLPSRPTRADWIAFASWQEGQGDVCVIRGDGTALVNLTRHPAKDSKSCWSPDGRWIAFESNRTGDSETWIMRADGTTLRNLTQHPAEDTEPAWSLDGSRIAFTSDRDGNGDIFVVSAAGGAPANVTNSAADEHAPAWSPDGSHLAVTSSRDGHWHIYVIQLATEEWIQLTDHGSHQDDTPAWSPDGRWIAYASTAGSGSDALASDIFLTSADGSTEKRLTYDNVWSWDPAWSPDGQWIVFTVQGDIAMMAADGSQRFVLVASHDYEDPSWCPVHPDGATLVPTLGWGILKTHR